MNATTVAVDLAKEVFELAFADADGRVVERKRLTRRAFARVFEQRPPLRIVMEACGSAHYWARRFMQQGHSVRLLPASDVRPYVRGNKTDRNDAAGILEADRCAAIADVPVKTPEQQGIQAQHRLREHLKCERTATINLLRGVLREFGIVIALGAAKVPLQVREALEDGDNDLPMALRHSLGEQLQRLVQLQADMHMIEQRLDEYAHRDVAVQRYQRVPGVGLLTATALRAGAGPEAEHADNNSGLRGRLNDRHPLRDFHDGPGIHAHRKAEYTNATAPLPDSKINRGTYRLTEESIYELLGHSLRDSQAAANP